MNLLRSQKTYTQKTLRYWWKKSKLTQTDGGIYHVLGLEESILSKWLSIDYRFSAISEKLPIAFFTELEIKKKKKLWKYRRPWVAKVILGIKWSYKNQALWLQHILQSYSNQNSKVLTCSVMSNSLWPSG